MTVDEINKVYLFDFQNYTIIILVFIFKVFESYNPPVIIIFAAHSFLLILFITIIKAIHKISPLIQVLIAIVFSFLS